MTRPDVAGRGLTCRFAEVMWPGAALHLWSLAPRLAPRTWLATLMFGGSRPQIALSSAFGDLRFARGAAPA